MIKIVQAHVQITVEGANILSLICLIQRLIFLPLCSLQLCVCVHFYQRWITLPSHIIAYHVVAVISITFFMLGNSSSWWRWWCYETMWLISLINIIHIRNIFAFWLRSFAFIYLIISCIWCICLQWLMYQIEKYWLSSSFFGYSRIFFRIFLKLFVQEGCF